MKIFFRPCQTRAKAQTHRAKMEVVPAAELAAGSGADPAAADAGEASMVDGELGSADSGNAAVMQEVEVAEEEKAVDAQESTAAPMEVTDTQDNAPADDPGAVDTPSTSAVAQPVAAEGGSGAASGQPAPGDPSPQPQSTAPTETDEVVEPYTPPPPPVPVAGNYYLVEVSVQCSRCGKWRRFVTTEVARAIYTRGAPWDCSMSPNPLENKCSAAAPLYRGTLVDAPNGPWNYAAVGVSSFDRKHYEAYFAQPGWTIEQTLALLDFVVVSGANDFAKASEAKAVAHSADECRARFWQLQALSKIFVQEYIREAKRSVADTTKARLLAHFESKLDLAQKARSLLQIQAAIRS